MELVSELRLKLKKIDRIEINDENAIKSSVLIPIIKRDWGHTILFTKRTEEVEHHKGQISFPGGVANLSDKNEVETALRETFEEIGIEKKSVEIIGKLNEVVTPTNFRISPIVGILQDGFTIKMNNDEVTEIFEIEMEKFFDESLMTIEERIINGSKRKIYFYNVWKEPIWGATAYFVKQIVDLIKK